MSIESIPEQPVSLDGLSLASRQALAILAVDGIRPSNVTMALMQAIDSGEITHDQAIQAILERARRMASGEKNP
jgi:hypothetical protein